MRSAYVHPHGEQEFDARSSSLLSEEDPIRLADIDRVLEDSAAVAQADFAASIRLWREELRVALESLTYARSVLASDVGILRHRLGSERARTEDLVEQLAEALSTTPWGDDWAEPGPGAGAGDDNWDVCVRSDLLMTAHQEMASTDLSSAADVTRVLQDVEAQLADLARRHDAVEERLAQVRAAVLRQYETGTVSARDWLG